MRFEVTIKPGFVSTGVNQLLHALEEKDVEIMDTAAENLTAFARMLRALKCPAAPTLEVTVPSVDFSDATVTGLSPTSPTPAPAETPRGNAPPAPSQAPAPQTPAALSKARIAIDVAQLLARLGPLACQGIYPKLPNYHKEEIKQAIYEYAAWFEVPADLRAILKLSEAGRAAVEAKATPSTDPASDLPANSSP